MSVFNLDICAYDRDGSKTTLKHGFGHLHPFSMPQCMLPIVENKTQAQRYIIHGKHKFDG